MNNPICIRFIRRALGLLAITFAIAIGGCASPAKFTSATGADAFPPYAGKVTVLENLPDSGQYRRVGVVTVEGVQLTKDADMLAAAKNKAAENGADAIVLQAPVKTIRDGSGGVKKKLAAWAIRLNK